MVQSDYTSILNATLQGYCCDDRELESGVHLAPDPRDENSRTRRKPKRWKNRCSVEESMGLVSEVVSEWRDSSPNGICPGLLVMPGPDSVHLLTAESSNQARSRG